MTKYCSIALKVLSLVLSLRGKKPHSTNDRTNFPHSAIATKYCGIVLKVLPLVLFGSKVQRYSTNVLCHYALTPYP